MSSDEPTASDVHPGLFRLKTAGSEGSEGAPPPWAPAVASQHLELLDRLGSRGVNTWAERALWATLEGVRDGPLIENIAVTEAWTDGPDAFCLLYTAPYGLPCPIVGIRRECGDTDWDVTRFLDDLSPRVAAGLMRTSAEDRAGLLRTSDDPIEFGGRLAEYISEPLGVFGKHLRFSIDGVGWWGTLDVNLPTQPS
jgi:hypothetical protein